MSLHTIVFLVILLPVINGSNVTSLITSSMARTKIFQIAATKTAVSSTNTILSTTTNRTAAEVSPRVGRNSTFAFINFPSSTPNTASTVTILQSDNFFTTLSPTEGKIKQDESNLPLIVGVAAPAVVIVLVIIVFIWFVNKRNKWRKLRSQVTVCYENWARLLSHLNHSFDARAYVLYRRLPEMNTLDISVIFISEFVDKKNEKGIVQLAYHCKENFHIGERGMLKRVKTRRTYKICLDFPGREKTFENFKMDEPQLDSSGFVVDCFKGLVMNFPAKGYVNISEINPNDGSEKLIWKLNVCEDDKMARPKIIENPVEPHPPVVLRKNLTHKEVTRISRRIAMDWDGLGGLLDIPYNERDEIRRNHIDYPDSFKRLRR
ncbi:uncharacterized protein LOC124459564 [Xenia sp. Carnegie-2017]|uniref:uncharacterized protein LOC124459564 n=1 Tax=Xenia sp. Carnegie-2017 TaxID=2897299 RepID=UPI001F03BC38|nr:uncharacterized protein LOC124459564 [Xenia sp. Carnegie-2017]